jgi:hypothetical protein
MSQELLKSVLRYDPETGNFFWLKRVACCIHVGDVAGSTDGRGYQEIMFGGRSYQSHNLAWLYMTGVWPKLIDHKNRIRNDNRWDNLREASRSVNAQNKSILSKNNSGLLGVNRNRKRFGAQIMIDGKNKYIGTFDTPELAHAAYLKAKRELHPGWIE